MFRKLFTIITLLTALAGCGLTALQKEKVSQYARATESISSSTEERFISTRDKIIEIERRVLILKNKNPPAKLDLDGGMNASGLSARIATLKALSAYGELLNKLASNDQSEALSNAASEFIIQYEAAEQTQDSNYRIPKEQQDAFAGIVSMVGSWFIEKEKKEQIKHFVNIYTPNVEKLAELLKHDLILKEDSLCIDKDKRKTAVIKTGVIDHYCTSAKKLYNASKFILRNNGHTFYEREFAYDSYILSTEALEEVNLLSKKGNSSIKSFIKANQQLTKVIESGKYKTEDIKNYAQQVKELNTLSKILTGK